MSSITSSSSSIQRCSNLENFLHSVTPIIKNAFVHVEDIKLQDIWEVYDEWSCCGVGIPVLLESGESIVQYYAPYLSAIQIYIRKSTSTTSHHDDGDDDDDDATAKSNDDKNLYVQFYESCSPYLRMPFLDKIIKLAQSYPGLLTLYINDISPASWMSISWYPIYHIPDSIYTTKDLCTCFLTFHILSRSFQESNINGPNLCQRLLINTLADNNEEGDLESGQVLDLVPFGLATYKMQGDVWINLEKGDDEKIKDLENAASLWLKQLHIQHHDFIFFTQ